MTGDSQDGEEAWRDLVAHYSSPDGEGGAPAPWPDRENLAGQDEPDSTDPAPDDTPGPGDDPVQGIIPAPPRLRIIRPATPAPPPDSDDDQHFVPPAPPPLPRLDPVSKGAWLALLGGPGYLLLAVLVGWHVPSVAAFLAVAAFIGGFATLVVRMGDRPPDDSGPGDGAVV